MFNSPNKSVGVIKGPPPQGKNLIINGNLTVDQRGVYTEYVADRWKIVDANSMTQIIEDLNFEPSTEYTLSWEGGTPQQITSPSSGHWTLPNIPRTARKIQLEKGEEATEFEHEDYGTTLAKCQRYCELIKIPFQGIYSSATFSGGSGTTANIGIFFKVEKRVIPTAPPSNSINYRAAAISFPTPTGPVDIYCESKILFRGISGVIAEVGVPVHFYTESSAIPVGPPCIFDAEL